MSVPAIEVSHFTKRYGDFTALDDLSFTVGSGEIFGLLGPNGAGKTTALECLEGLRQADSGTLRVMGLNPALEFKKLIRQIGVQLQTGALPGHITVQQAVNLFSAYHGVKPDLKLVERMGLMEKYKSAYHTLSIGQKRRLALALAIVHRPAVIFLDEPTAGLDIYTRSALHTLMLELRAHGSTIILSTHDMAEAESMADRVAILLKGRITAIGSPRELTSAGSTTTKISVHTTGHSLHTTTFAGVERRDKQAEYELYFTRTPGPLAASIIRHIEDCGDQLIDLRVERPTLEERFLELTQSALELS